MAKKQETTDHLAEQSAKLATAAEEASAIAAQEREDRAQLLLPIRLEQAKIAKRSLEFIAEEFHNVRSGHHPRSEEFMNCLQNLAAIANDHTKLLVVNDGISLEEFEQALNPPPPPTETPEAISSAEPHVVDPVSPSPVEEPLPTSDPKDQ